MSESEVVNKEKNFLDELGLIAGKGLEVWEKAIKENLNLEVVDLKMAVISWLQTNAEQVANEFINIIPNGDYGELIEGAKEITEYLRTEASNTDNWKLVEARVRDNLLALVFNCTIVDEGDTFKGFVFISKNGKIKHAFAQNQD